MLQCYATLCVPENAQAIFFMLRPGITNTMLFGYFWAGTARHVPKARTTNKLIQIKITILITVQVNVVSQMGSDPLFFS